MNDQINNQRLPLFRRILNRFGGVTIFILLTLFLSVYIVQLSSFTREDMIGIPQAAFIPPVLYSVLWFFISLYLLVFYALKSKVPHRKSKSAAITLCAVTPWSAMWLPVLCN